ncbi:MAG: CoB--CoM heterodisulfide reductase iron-sulfur subunit B family protein [Chloroflexi bacterium]|nr:CoB--CoM heterodisulfide reductase iron-sulfur subunit B family protein [Chloroflexota bacterium]
MRYAYYPGCVAQGGAPELFNAMRLVAERIGLSLEHLKEASCTGAGVLQERDPELGDTLNARTLAMAEKRGLPLMTICSTCQGVISQANYRLKKDADYRKFINHYLAPEGLEYKGTTDVKHFMWVLVEDYGLDRLKEQVKRPLNGVALAPFYGCYVLRPSAALGFDQHPKRETYLEQIIAALGGTPVDFAGKTKCCGFPILTMNRDNSLRMAGTHLLDAKHAGADAMVTPCPLCHLNLDGQQPDAAKVHKTQINLPVIHLPQMVGVAMGIDPGSLGLNRHIVSTRRFAAKVPA